MFLRPASVLIGFLLWILAVPSPLYAEQKVCVSNDTLPKHCKAGDIIVVRPKHVALVCDFNQQIVKLQPSKTAKEFLCRYTGKILSIQPNTSKPPPPPPMNYPPQKKKRKTFFW